MIIVVIVVVVVLAILVFGAQITNNIAVANQAAATIEVAKVARTAQSTASVLIIVLAVLAVVLVVGSISFAILFVRYRLAAERGSAGKWVSGPNANFGRVGPGNQTPDITTLITLLMLKQLSDGNRTANTGSDLAVPTRSFDDIVDGWDWDK